MLELPMPEMIVFSAVLVTYLAAAIVGVLQLRAGGDKFKHYLVPLVALAVSLEAVILIFRAVAINAIPLTGLFESMVVLTLVFGLIYLFFSIPVRQVWFGSVVTWVILATIILAALVAKPASQPQAIAATPWAVAHAIAMILSGVAIMLASASAGLYLLASRSLKQKKVTRVLGKMPNFEKLGQMNLFGLKASFILMTFGLVSGVGMAVAGSSKLQLGLVDWLTDSKIVIVMAVWVMVAIILVMHHLGAIKVRLRAHITIAAFVLILFAVVGTTLFCSTKHRFSQGQRCPAEQQRQVVGK